ncbi:MAG: hypothetical protein A2629_00355 [Candidatus Levybacteria bacterium RIFCSPHIGHO2_01_FULL_41_15]|nr:MAG: hypothetical protein A2629_00355 [Candidatus Levybacteria bacterium RIFCSPHIGHO2_01_FULL_41_15]
MKYQKIILFDIDYTLFNTDVFKQTDLKKHSVYDEVNNVLKELGKVGILGIFSEGDLEFQKNKLFRTDIQKHFLKAHMHITEKKEKILKKVLRKYKDKKVFLIDDKLSILHLAKTISPSLFAIWVKRGMYAKNQKPIPEFKPDTEVENLKEIIPIILNS